MPSAPSPLRMEATTWYVSCAPSPAVSQSRRAAGQGRSLLQMSPGPDSLTLVTNVWSSPARKGSAWVQPRRTASFQPDFPRPSAGAGDSGVHACAAQHQAAHDDGRLHRICHRGMVLPGRRILWLRCLRWAAPCSFSRSPALFACHRLGLLTLYWFLRVVIVWPAAQH